MNCKKTNENKVLKKMFYKDGLMKVKRSISENSRAKLSIVYVRSWSQKMHRQQKFCKHVAGL